jgi:hypothetical protein
LVRGVQIEGRYFCRIARRAGAASRQNKKYINGNEHGDVDQC